MLKKLLPIVFLLAGTGAGIGAGMVLTGPSGDKDMAKADAKIDPAEKKDKASKDGKEDGGTEFIKMHSQFVVPIIRHNEVSALVVMSLSLEAEPGLSEKFYAREPKLRDMFLQVLFDHANMGGFDGAFTSPSALDPLRTALREVAQAQMGDSIHSVLITDLARQDT